MERERDGERMLGGMIFYSFAGELIAGDDEL